MDVGALALNIDSSSVVKAANDLDRFAASSDRAKAAAGSIGATFGNQSGSIAKLVASVQSIDNKLSSIIGTLDKVARANRAAAAANDNMGSSAAKAGASVAVADAHVIAYTQHLAGLASAQRMADAHVQAFQNHMSASGRAIQQADAHVQAYAEHLRRLAATPSSPNGPSPTVPDATPGTLNETGRAAQLASQHVANLAYQLNDIFVSLASGQNPMMVFIQQGSQIGQIYGQSGLSLKQFALAVAGMLAPLWPVIVVLGIAAAAVAALTKQANDDSGLKKYTTAMGYTKAEVAKLNAVTVTAGDTAKAVFQVGFERIASAFGISTGDIKKAWQSVMDFLITAARATVAAIYAAMTGLMYAVKRTYDNIKSGTLEDPFTTLKEGYKSAYGDAQTFMDDVVKRAQKNARDRQDSLAKALYDAPTGTKSDPLGNILRDAEAQIKAEQARGAAVGLSARAAAELEQRTKLLNDIEKAKIPVTDALRGKVSELAQAYSDAKVAADTAAAVQGVIDNSQKQRDAINDETALIGLYGDALNRARLEMEALTAARNALPRGEELSSADSARILEDARKTAADLANQGQQVRMEAIRKDAEDAAYALDLERKGLGLTGAAAESYAYVVERLNEAKQQGIDLSPDEVAAIKAAGDAYGAARYAIDQQAKAISDAREVTKGFFADWINGVREGANVFKSFADSVINSLNRIIDKMLDKTLDGFLNSMFSGGSGGFLGGLFGGWKSNLTGIKPDGTQGVPGDIVRWATGGAFGTAQRFANGGTFTNSIVTTPTLFRFANGAKIGEMGEAGPEAIMPLKRGPNGSLGVQMHGGGKPAIRMGDYNPTFQFAGAIGIDGIASMIRQGGEATYNQMKRDLQSLLQQLDTDGAFSS